MNPFGDVMYREMVEDATLSRSEDPVADDEDEVLVELERC